MIAEGVLAIEMAALAKDVALTIHPHPTLSETVMESAEVFFGTSTRHLPAKARIAARYSQSTARCLSRFDTINSARYCALRMRDAHKT